MEDHQATQPIPLDSGGWAAFNRAHLHDYNVHAIRFWIGIAMVGVLALALALLRLSESSAGELWQVLGWIAIAAIAAAFPIQIPRSKHSIATGDIVIFLLLALHGAAAAVVAASLEALIASSRTSTRVSSRIASAAAGAGAMMLA